jgi:nucleoside-diphosphate-sugar epimerase
MRLLITGAGGFLGAHLVRGIAAAMPRAQILATDAAMPPEPMVAAFWSPFAARIETTALDVTDAAAVRALVAAFVPDHVVHAAALTPTAEQEDADPARIMAVNIDGVLHIIDAATRVAVVRRVILISSSTVFGPGSGGLAAEMSPACPATLYGVTKLAAEGIARRLGELRGISVVATRLAGVYGAMERATASRPRPSHIHRLAATASPSVSTLDVVRDYVHADDVAGAIGKLLAAPALAHALYHVGGGEPVGWRRLVAAFRAAGRDSRDALPGEEPDISMEAGDARPVMSIARLQGELGFAPRSIEAGVMSLVDALPTTAPR